MHLPREPNSFIVRRIRFGDRLKWGINILLSQAHTQLCSLRLLDGKIPSNTTLTAHPYAYRIVPETRVGYAK